MFSIQNFVSVSLASNVFTVSLSCSINSFEPSFTCVPVLFIRSSSSGMSSSLLLVSVGGSGTVLCFGSFLGLKIVVWLACGNFNEGYSSGHSFLFEAQTKWSLQTLVLLFNGRFSRHIFCIQTFNNTLFFNGKPKYESSVSLFDRFEQPGTQQKCTIVILILQITRCPLCRIYCGF